MRRRTIFGEVDEQVLPRLPFSDSLPTGGAGVLQEDGLAGTQDYRHIAVMIPRVGGEVLQEVFTEQINVYYMLGGVRGTFGGPFTAYNALYLDRFFKEYVLLDGVVSSAKVEGFGSPRLIEKYTPGSGGLFHSPAITGMSFLGVKPENGGARSIGLYGVRDLGFEPGSTSWGANFGGRTQIVDLETDFRVSTPDRIVPLADFQTPLHGALAASRERGSLFAVADVQRAVDGGGYRAVLEFDPRDTYVVNAWSSARGDFDVLGGTVVNSGGRAVHDFADPGLRATGAAFVQGHLVVSFDQAGPETRSAQYFTFNPDAVNTAADPGVRRIDAGVPPSTALAELSNLTKALPARRTLAPPGGPIDTVSINELFSRIAYSQQALDSGVVRHIFEKHFQETAINPAGCTRGNPVFDRIPEKLSQFVDTRKGFGRVAYELRHPDGMPLTSDNACAAPNAPAPGQQSSRPTTSRRRR